MIPKYFEISLYLPFKRTQLKYMCEVHEVKVNLKLNSTNIGSTAKCKCCRDIRMTLEYNSIDGFEFWPILRVLIEYTGSTLRTKHTNLTVIMLTGYDHMVDVVKLHAIYLFMSCYLGTLL